MLMHAARFHFLDTCYDACAVILRVSVQERHTLAMGGCSVLPLDTISRLQTAFLKGKVAR